MSVTSSLRVLARLSIAFAVAAAALPVVAHASPASPTVVFTPGRGHVLPRRGASTNAAMTNQCKTACSMEYWGGPVEAQTTDNVVLFGSGVDPGASSAVASLYQDLNATNYIGKLAEYNTTGLNGQDGQPGSNQSITATSYYGGTYTLSPSGCSTGSTCTVHDAAIQQALAAAFTANTLTQPSAGENYTVMFAKDVQVCQGATLSSCSSSANGGTWAMCAYHSTFVYNSVDVTYQVIPSEYSAGTSCGSDPNYYNNLTVGVSHELAETITDPDVGLLNGGPYARPAAWGQSGNGEIGDPCNWQQSNVALNGTTHAVTQWWSNASNDCIAPTGQQSNFSLSLSPSSASAIAGASSAQYTIQTSATAGAAETVTLSVTGLPSGVTAAIGPTSLTSGQSASLTLTPAAGTPSYSNLAFDVVGTATTGQHQTVGYLTVTQPDFTFSVSPPSQTVAPGQSVSYTVTTATVGGAPQAVQLSTGTLPTGVTASFSPSSVLSGQQSTMTLSAATTAPVVTNAAISVVGVGTTYTHSFGVSLTVAVPVANDFSVSLSPASQTVTAGQSVSYTVSTATTSGSAQSLTLAVAGSLPQGVTAAFSANPITSGQTSVLTLSTFSNAPPATNYTVSVQASAASGWHTATADLSITQPVVSDYSVAISPAAQSVVQGQSVQYTVSTQTTSGLVEQVGLYVSGLPAGVTGSFSPQVVNSGSSSTLTLTAASSAAPITAAPFTITGNGSGGVHTTSASVTVLPANDFSVSVSPASRSVTTGTSVTYTVTTATTAGTAQTVTLAVSGLPSGVTGTFSAASVLSGATSTLTLAAASTAAVAPSTTFNVTATGSQVARTATAAVAVVAPSTSPIVNGSFQSGTLKGWKVTGSASVGSGGDAGDTYVAIVGNPYAASTTSTIKQTFVVPAGGTAVSFMWWGFCQDATAHDATYATLRDVTTGVTTKLLRKCAKSTAWTVVTAPVTAGHTVTLTLGNQDDNDTGTPSYSAFDGVAMTLTATTTTATVAPAPPVAAIPQAAAAPRRARAW